MMPAYQVLELLTRLGLALAAGILIAIIPVALRKARFEPHIGKRITLYVIGFVATVAFAVYGWFLWDRFVPREAEPEAPIIYPVTPP